MSVTPPLPIDDLPPSPSPDRPDTFDAEADAFLEKLQPYGQQVEALGQNVYANAVDAASSATAASNASTTAVSSASAAESARNQAGAFREDAETFAAAAEGAAFQAAASAAAAGTSTIATSTSSVTVGYGTKTFTVPADKQFGVDQPLVAANGTNKIYFSVFSYSGTTLVGTVTSTEGTGTFNSWTISPSGAQGPAGGTAGGTLTDAINEKKGTAPASSATPDIWGAGGNYVPITQTATITGFPNAPQAGARRTLFVINGFTLTSGANLMVRGGTRVLNPSDEVEVVADTVSTFYAKITRGNGLPVASTVFMNAEMYTATATIPLRKSGPARAILVGCGGSGATRNASSSPTNSTVSATGGGAGGMAVKDFDSNGGTLTFIGGAPGAGAPNAQNGNDGGASTLSGSGISLTANGGRGGTGTDTTPTLLTGALGGTATGGDQNIQGGNSGSCAANVATGGVIHAQATGGGAVGWRGVGYPSGNVNAPASPGTSVASGTGGAGVGGASGNVSPASGATVARSGGGGSLSASPAVTTGQGANGSGQLSYVGGSLQLNGDGSGAGAGQNNGGGSPALAASTVAAGALAGSGAVAVITSGTFSSGPPGLGAGSGGAASASGATALSTSTGGAAFALILS